MALDDTLHVGGIPDSVKIEELNNEYRIKPDDDGQTVHDLLESLGPGDRAVFPPGFSATAPDTITLADDVTLLAENPMGGTNPTLTKGANGSLMEYGGRFTAVGLHLDGDSNNFTGDVLSPAHGDTPECYLERCRVWDAESAAMRMDEFYLSTIIQCQFGSSQDGWVLEGNTHSPHNTFVNINITGNSRAGVDLRHSFDGSVFIGSLIHNNLYGFDSERAGIGNVFGHRIGPGTGVQNNDGPGMICQGATASSISAHVMSGARVAGNNDSPPTGLTDTNGLGDIHSENGGQITGTISGYGGEIRRYNSTGTNGDLTISGSADDVNSPDTFLVVLNDANVGSVSVQSGIGLDPMGGGGTVTY